MRLFPVLLALNILLALLLVAELHRPSDTRDWQRDQAVMAQATFDGDLVHIENVRNFIYRTTRDYAPAYYNATYNLSELTTVYFLQEDISTFKPLAHTMLTFTFADGRHLTLSVEARKEVGESYSPLKGVLRQYELIYVIGDESDVIRLRTNYRNDMVRMYPIKTTPGNARMLLTSMLEEATALRERPQFYNTLTSTCTTNLVKHANRVTPGRIPTRIGVLLPGYADRLAYDQGLIDTTLTFEEAREFSIITRRAQACGECAEYSAIIRQFE
jgi:hypothetical protein